MKWTDLSVTVPLAQAETAEAIASGISGSGIYVEDYSDLEEQVRAIAHVDLIEPDLLAKDRGTVRVHLYLSPDEPPAEVLQLLRERLAAAGLSARIGVAGVEQEDWENSWKKYYHALTVGRRLAVCPSWETFDAPGRRVIRIDPGMAFGTGTHETTSLCLAAIDGLVKGGERMLDIGTGSGILAIGALLLGAGEADGIDIDPMCVRTAAENAARNGVDGRFRAIAGDLSSAASGTYDLITANILADAVMRLAPAVPTLLSAGGVFISSGIITERRDEVEESIRRAGLTVLRTDVKNGWVCILAGRSEQA